MRIIMRPYRDGGTGPFKASWFDLDKASAVFTRDDVQLPDSYPAAGWTPGDGTATHGQRLVRTAAGLWALEVKGGCDAYPWQWVEPGEARDMLITRFKVPDEEIARWLPAPEDERGPNLGGRPPIGPQLPVALPADLRARVEQYAAQHDGISLAEAARRLIASSPGLPAAVQDEPQPGQVR